MSHALVTVRDLITALLAAADAVNSLSAGTQVLAAWEGNAWPIHGIVRGDYGALLIDCTSYHPWFKREDYLVLSDEAREWFKEHPKS
jgi:hypothetical protein